MHMDDTTVPPPSPQAFNDPLASSTEIEASEVTLEAQLLEKNEALLKAQADLLLARADLENFRKRAAREQEEARKYAITHFARDILAVADNLDRALSSLPQELNDARIQTVVEGVAYVQQEIHALFSRHHIEKVAALQQKFDPHLHQAMVEVETTEHLPGTVVRVLQEGYQLGERLLRPALVGVAKAPSPDAPVGT
jgi:molecular chaperone GrpE